MDILFVPLFTVLIKIVDLYQFFLIIYVVLGWLEVFNVVNRYNRFVYGIHTILFRLIEPVLTPIRRFLPDMGGIDFSPLVLIFGLYFIQGVLEKIVHKFPA
jgi:YggT family protein